MSNDSATHYAVESVEGVSILTIKGNQIAPETRDALYEFCDRLTQTPEPRFVALDLSNVRVLNSSAIGILINFQKRLRDVRASLKLCSIDPFVLDLFRLTKMDQVIDIRRDRHDAVDAFHAKTRPAASASGSGDSGEKKGWIGKLFGGKK
ncbi:MAG: STAS domain-containing protein [Isosphaeraceae bacterium]